MTSSLSGLDDLVIGSLVAIVGLVALLLLVARSHRVDPLLAGFGVFALLYGVRLFFSTPLVAGLGVTAGGARWVVDTITYLINVPAWFFFWRLLGPGWRSLVAVWLGVMSAFAVVGIATDLVTGTPGTLSGAPNNVLVILGMAAAVTALLRQRRRLTKDLSVLLGGFLVFGLFAVNDNLVSLGWVPWSWRDETLGFLAFLGCLGAITARKVFAGERQLAALEGEIEAARQIQTALLPGSLPTIGTLRLASRFRPTSTVAGDLWDVLAAGPGRAGILVADVCGHGVPAALVASMVKVAAKAHAEKADRPSELLAAIHRTLYGEVKRGFVTAIYTFVDADRGELVVASAGHPPPLLQRAGDSSPVEVGGLGPVLGRFADPHFHEERLAMGPGDRLVLATDGLIEAQSPSGEMFGDCRLRAFLADHGDRDAETLCDELLESLRRWTGGSAELELEDDLTLIVLDGPSRRPHAAAGALAG